MNNDEARSPRIHEDPALFKEAVGFTAAKTGFSKRLIEKDYFCTVLLAYLASQRGSKLVFKGGTCLAKVHAEFYRMSEDLDFVIPVATTSSRSERSRQASTIKKHFSTVSVSVPHMGLAEPLRGANESRQYLGKVSYESLVQPGEDTIKIEVALREPLLTPAVQHPARTALLDPISNETLVPDFPIRCISKAEAFAEKFRAALTRREVAIRDFYDIDYSITNLGLQSTDGEMVKLVRKKIAVPGNDPVDVSDARISTLRGQLAARLRPVLRDRDYRQFDLDRAIGTVLQMAELLGNAEKT